MIRLGILTTVWKRPAITQFHFVWMHQFEKYCQSLGIQVLPFYVLGKNDGHKKIFAEDLDRYGHAYTVVPRQPLSNKSQAGLEALKDTYDIDWLMHLDSDEIVSDQLMRVWKKQFESQVDWFGSESCYFFHAYTSEMWEFKGYHNHPIKNGGSCVSKLVLEGVEWRLWDNGYNKSLNNNEHRRIQKKVPIRPKVIDTQDYYGVVEIKGGDTAIHSMDWFYKKDLLRRLEDKEEDELLNAHPLLKTLV